MTFEEFRAALKYHQPSQYGDPYLQLLERKHNAGESLDAYGPSSAHTLPTYAIDPYAPEPPRHIQGAGQPVLPGRQRFNLPPATITGDPMGPAVRDPMEDRTWAPSGSVRDWERMEWEKEEEMGYHNRAGRVEPSGPAAGGLIQWLRQRAALEPDKHRARLETMRNALGQNNQRYGSQ